MNSIRCTRRLNLEQGNVCYAGDVLVEGRRMRNNTALTLGEMQNYVASGFFEWSEGGSSTDETGREPLNQEGSRAPSDRLSEEEKLVKSEQQLAETDQGDNLENINGIGPRFKDTLFSLGIHTFDQLADLSEERIREISDIIPRVTAQDVLSWRTAASVRVAAVIHADEYRDEDIE